MRGDNDRGSTLVYHSPANTGYSLNAAETKEHFLSLRLPGAFPVLQTQASLSATGEASLLRGL